MDAALSSEMIQFSSTQEIEFVGVKVNFKSFNAFITCSYIPPLSDMVVYFNNLEAIQFVSSLVSS